MTAKKGKKQQKGAKKAQQAQALLVERREEEYGAEVVTGCIGYVEGATAGCHVAYLTAEWILGVEPLVMADYPGVEEEELPEISICPDSGVLTTINCNSELCKSFFMSIPVERIGNGDSYDIVTRDSSEGALSVGHYRNADGDDKECVTFVAVVAPRSVMDLCYIEFHGDKSLEEVDLFSDIKDVPEMPPFRDINPQEAVRIRFPLQSGNSSGEDRFLCSQGFGGRFTHFYPATYFAVDLQCPVGTPVIAVGDGIVTAVRDDSTVGGIHAMNLFHWNSVTIQLKDSGKFVEYVHIQNGSVRVAVGDIVEAGQILCHSGDVGFCPTPHLHLQVHDSDDDTAPTVPFVFISQESETRDSDAAPPCYAPRAGQHCPPVNQ